MNSTEPKDGDFTKYLLQRSAELAVAPVQTPVGSSKDDNADEHFDLAAYEARVAEEATEAEADAAEQQELRAATEGLPPLSDDELAEQALAHGGLDGDPSTPE